jgi:hypothetical protein
MTHQSKVQEYRERGKKKLKKYTIIWHIQERFIPTRFSP